MHFMQGIYNLTILPEKDVQRYFFKNWFHNYVSEVTVKAWSTWDKMTSEGYEKKVLSDIYRLIDDLQVNIHNNGNMAITKSSRCAGVLILQSAHPPSNINFSCSNTILPFIINNPQISNSSSTCE